MTITLSLPESPRILIINVARFGDTLLMTPAIAALRERWPQADITVLAHPKRMEVLFQNTDIDRVAGITKHSAVWCGWFGKGYDVALVYGRDWPLLRYAHRVARQVVAYYEPDIPSLSRLQVVARPALQIPAAEEFALPLKPLGVFPTHWSLVYRVTDAETQVARQWLEQQGIVNSSLVVGFQLQSFPSKSYRDWPPEYFNELALRLLSYDSAVKILLLGGPESRELAEGLANALGERVIATAGCFAMRENAAILAQLALYVGVDTGPTHLAGALGIPMVGLYHCYHRGCYLAPRQHPRLTVIEHPLSDAERTRDASMGDISVQQVWEAVQHHLELARYQQKEVVLS